MEIYWKIKFISELCFGFNLSLQQSVLIPPIRRLFNAMTDNGSETRPKIDYVLATLRISLGSIFLWAFLDKMFGLGYATSSEDAWINGGSPTEGYLQFAAGGIL